MLNVFAAKNEAERRALAEFREAGRRDHVDVKAEATCEPIDAMCALPAVASTGRWRSPDASGQSARDRSTDFAN